MLRLLNEPAYAKSIITEAERIHSGKSNTQESDRLRVKVRGIGEQIGILAEHLLQIPKGLSPAPVFAQMQKLEDMKKTTQESLDAIVSGGHFGEMPASLKDFEGLLALLRKDLAKATPEAQDLKCKIVQRLVHKVEILAEGYRIYFYVGKNEILPRFYEEKEKREKAKQSQSLKSEESDFSLVHGSKMMLTSAPTGIQTPVLAVRVLSLR